MAAEMGESGTMPSKRNKAIVAALAKRFSIDPKNLSADIINECDITALLSKVLQLSESEVTLSNQTEVAKWVKFSSEFPRERDACHAVLKALTEDLNQKSVLLGDGLTPSEADIVVFSSLHSFVSHLTEAEMQNLPNVVRWMDYIQNIEDFGGQLEMIVVKKPGFEPFGLKGVKFNTDPTSKKVAQEPKNFGKPEENLSVNRGSIETKTSGNDKAAESKKASKSAEEKKKPPEKESSEKDTECSITILNIQVGVIRKAWKHPSADSLLVEEIDLGDGNVRQVVSGLAKYYSPEDLSNRRVVLITNVKPGKLRDVMSAGLVLCASNQDHTVVEPLIPPEGAMLGERVLFSGYEGKPEDVLNPKKKQLEKITPHLYTDEKGVATFKGTLFMTTAGPCTSSIAHASIK